MAEEWINELAEEIRSIVQEAMREKEGERELYETIMEDVEIKTDRDWRDVFDYEVPSILKRVLERAGLTCSLYHRKDDVPGFEYVANCTTKDGERIALGFDVDYDPDTYEVQLQFVQAWRESRWTPTQLVYYHEV